MEIKHIYIPHVLEDVLVPKFLAINAQEREREQVIFDSFFVLQSYLKGMLQRDAFSVPLSLLFTFQYQCPEKGPVNLLYEIDFSNKKNRPVEVIEIEWNVPRTEYRLYLTNVVEIELYNNYAKAKSYIADQEGYFFPSSPYLSWNEREFNYPECTQSLPSAALTTEFPEIKTLHEYISSWQFAGEDVLQQIDALKQKDSPTVLFIPNVENRIGEENLYRFIYILGHDLPSQAQIIFSTNSESLLEILPRQYVVRPQNNKRENIYISRAFHSLNRIRQSKTSHLNMYYP